MPDETRYCKRIESHVYFDRLEDPGRVFVVCKYYDVGNCNINPIIQSKCLINLVIQKEEKNKLLL